MARLLPEELWQKHLLERYLAFKLTGDWLLLREEGLRILGRSELLDAQEWWASSKNQTSKEYFTWYEKCRIEGQRFGLSPWVVEMTCLLKNYQPEKEPHPIGIDWPKVRVVTDSTDVQFLNWLAYHAQKLGLYVVQRQGSIEEAFIYLNPLPMEATVGPPTPSSMPLFSKAFHMRTEVPTDYPPKAASRIQKEAGLMGKDLLKLLGYQGFQRIRVSSLTSQVQTLEVNKKRLSRRKLYEVVADMTPDEVLQEDLSNISPENDTKMTKLLKHRRHQLRNRLVEPYINSDKSKDP